MHANRGAGRLIAGRYRLQDPIGRGSMGIVWRGRDELLHRDVAVKEVQLIALSSPDAVPAAETDVLYQRVLREARTAAQLTHPSAVTVYDVVEEDGSPWIIMELIKARSLDRVIIEDGPLPPLQAAELGLSLISALAAAHSAGVLHRDVKPSNVLVTREGRAVLTDFGIATFAEDPTMTLAGIVVGTPGFTAPERVRGDVATRASDLWSLGATLFAAVEGRGPFDRVGGSTAITAGVVLEDAPRAPSAGTLGPVIDALLRRDPAARPDAAATAKMLAEAATAARTGARSLGDGWLAAEADTASPLVGASAVSDAASLRDVASAVSDAASPGRVDGPTDPVGAAAVYAGVGARTGHAAGASGGQGPAALADLAAMAMGTAAADTSGAGTSGAGTSGAGTGAGTSSARPDSARLDTAAAVPGQGPAAVKAAVEEPPADDSSLGHVPGPAAFADPPRDSAAAMPPMAGDPGLGSTPAPSPDASADAARRAAFLDPPVYADLSMPDPTGQGELPPSLGSVPPEVPAGPFADLVAGGAGAVAAGGAVTGGSGPGASGADTSSGGAGAAGGSGGTSGPGGGSPQAPNRSRRPRPSSGRWRVMVACAGVAAIGIAAVIGWDVYNHTQIPLALDRPASPSASGTGGSSPAKTGHSGSTAGRKPGSSSTPATGRSGVTSPSHGHTPTTSAPSANPSAKPSSHTSPTQSTSPVTKPSTSVSASASPSPSPSPSPTSTQPVLPAGWVWHTFTASLMGSTAGFEIGMPPPWKQNVVGQIAHLNQPAKNFHLAVNLAPWAYPGALRQAEHIDAADSATYNKFKTLVLRGVGFGAVGGYEAAKAAELKFSWVRPDVGKFTELVILVNLSTSSGAQPYTLSAWAPSATFPSASGVFRTALRTFRPLPS